VEHEAREDETPLPRRTVLQGLSVLALAPWLSDEGLLAFAHIQKAAAPAALRVLTPAEFATLEALLEALIPADERSAGAREARVAAYVDLLLEESPEETRAAWRSGLALVEAEAQARFGASFPRLTPDHQEALLTEMSRNEAAPQSALEAFFKTTKDAAIRGYYTSEIGIHRELRYQGNSFTPEFVGCLAEEGRDCPHCGAKAAR
jgi:hypothetical protein